MARKRPIPPSVWKKHKDQIIQVYEGDKLDGVIAFMKGKGLDANRRQYIYRLEQWGARKYDTQKSRIAKQVASPGSAYDGESAVSAEDGLSPNPVVISNSGAENNTRVCQWVHEQPVGSFQKQSSDNLEESDWPSDQDIATKQHPSVQLDGSFNHDRELLAVDFCFSICDDIHASSLLKSVYRTLQKERALAPSFRVKLTINTARCMQTSKEANNTRHMVNTNLQHFSTSDAPVDNFLFWALYVRTFDTTAGKSCDKSPIAQIEQIVQKILYQGHLASLPQRGLVLDLVTFQCLSYVVSRYNDHLPAGTCLDVNSILRQFIQQRGNINHQQSSIHTRISCIRSCLQWCLRELGEGTEPQSPLHDIPTEPDGSNEAYKGDLEIFAHLWHTWRASKSTGDDSCSTWDKTVEKELGICATELLATITWMLTSLAPTPSPASTGTTATELLAAASEGAAELASLDDAALLRSFLDRFLSMNSPVQTTPAEQEFRDLAHAHLRAFAEGVLHVRIPSPQDISKGDKPASRDQSPSTHSPIFLNNRPRARASPDRSSWSWSGTMSEDGDWADSSVTYWE